MTRRSHEWVDEHTGVRIVSTPDTLCGAWRLDGHRIDTAGIAALWRAGETVDAIARCYMISVDQVEACILFESTGPGEHARAHAALLELYDSVREVVEPVVHAVAELARRTQHRVESTDPGVEVACDAYDAEYFSCGAGPEAPPCYHDGDFYKCQHERQREIEEAINDE